MEGRVVSTIWTHRTCCFNSTSSSPLNKQDSRCSKERDAVYTSAPSCKQTLLTLVPWSYGHRAAHYTVTKKGDAKAMTLQSSWVRVKEKERKQVLRYWKQKWKATLPCKTSLWPPGKCCSSKSRLQRKDGRQQAQSEFSMLGYCLWVSAVWTSLLDTQKQLQQEAELTHSQCTAATSHRTRAAQALQRAEDISTGSYSTEATFREGR